MTSLSAIIGHLGSILDPDLFDDYGPNGLQIPGRDEVETIVTGVSASVELFERAGAIGADLVLVHHGLLWAGPPRNLDRSAKRRLQLLFDADMSLAAYHLPLDAHLEHGNNALLAGALGCASWEPFGRHRGRTIGVAGRLPGEGIAAEELVARVGAVTGRDPLAFTAGPPRVRSVGLVSGAGADHLASTRTASRPPITDWPCPHSGQGLRPCTLAAPLPAPNAKRLVGAGGRLDGTRTYERNH